MRLPLVALTLAALGLLATACSSGDAAVGHGLASVVVPIPVSPSSTTPPSSSVDPSTLALTPVSGVYAGLAHLTSTNVNGVSHRPQRIHWSFRPRCGSADCPVQLVSKSGGFSVLLHRHGPAYEGSTRRNGFFSCAGKPERVTLRIVVQPTESATLGNGRVAARIAATLRNVSVPSPKCRRSYLNTTVAANRT
jgi:hypothetical protein